MPSIAVTGLAALLAALCFTSCAAERDAEPAPEAAPNVLLYVVDSLRADGLGYDGNPRARTPNIDRFAREAMIFEQAFAQSSWTRPSMASIFTGNYPSRHGAERRSDPLPSEAQTLAELLRDAGYATGYITTNPNVGSFLGFSQGFDHTVELYARRSPGEVKEQELIATSDQVTEEAIAWLSGAPRPFFLAILTVDPHAPYDPPDRFLRPVGDSFDDDRRESPSEESKARGRARRRPRSRYQGEVSFNDESFGLLIDYLRTERILDDTIAVFTSDHGEEFGEHGGRLHGRTLYDEVLRVPLLIRYPRSQKVRGGTRTARPTRSIDITAALLDLLGLAASSPIDGLSPLGGDAEAAPAIYSSLKLDRLDMRALRDYPWKLTVDRNEGTATLHHLADDPGESAARSPVDDPAARAALARLQQQLGELETSAVAGGDPPPLPEDARKTLEALGYLEPSPIDDADPRRAP